METTKSSQSILTLEKVAKWLIILLLAIPTAPFWMGLYAVGTWFCVSMLTVGWAIDPK